MRSYDFIQVDVFTDVVFGGNPLAVFPDAEGLSDSEMGKIAREMGLSETTFVLPPTNEDADVRIRFFTPSSELPFAGHPTIGTHLVLASLGRYQLTPPFTRIRQETAIGILPVDLITDNEGETRRAVMTQGELQQGPIFEDKSRLAAALGLEIEDIHPDLPAQVLSTGLPALIVPLKSLAAASRVSLNLSVFNRVCQEMGISSVEVFCTETADPGSHAHVRSFHPLLGVYEDPATGSIAGAVGCYLILHDVLPDPTSYFILEQGLEINRPSLLEVDIERVGDAITQVRVSGQARIVLRGVLYLG